MKNSKKTFVYVGILTSILILVISFLLSFDGRYFIYDISSPDTSIFLWINRHHYPVLDGLMYVASDKLFWLPLYVLLCCFIVKSFRQKSWQILLVIAILIITSDQLSSHLIKNSVMRLRPSHVTALIPLIHLSKAGPGGLYGFVSSHAANASALAVFLSFLFDKSLIALKYVLTGWALLVSYSRIYNGVHYPADVVVALLIGSLLGILFYFIYHLIFLKPFRDAV